MIPDFWFPSNSISAKVDLKVRLGRSNSKMVVYWEVRPHSHEGSVENFCLVGFGWEYRIYVLRPNVICRCLLVLFCYDGSTFYDSQKGVGRVNVKYRNGLIWVFLFERFFSLDFCQLPDFTPIYAEKVRQKTFQNQTLLFLQHVETPRWWFQWFFGFFTIPLTGSKPPITPPSGSMHQVLDNPSMMRWCDQILMTDVLICIDGICCTTKVVIRKTREALFRNDGSMGLAYMKTINITIPVGKYASFMDPMGFNFPSSRHPFFKPLLQAVWKSQAKLPGVWGFMADWEFWWHFRLGFKSMAKHRCNYVEALLET